MAMWAITFSPLVLWPLQYVLAQPSHSEATNTNYPWWKESGSCPVVHVLHECVASSLTNKGIKLFTCAGVSFQEAKTLMIVMLFSALGLNHEPCCSGFWPVCGYNTGANNVSALIAMMITLLCIALGYITLLRWEVHKLRGEKELRWLEWRSGKSAGSAEKGKRIRKNNGKTEWEASSREWWGRETDRWWNGGKEEPPRCRYRR